MIWSDNNGSFSITGKKTCRVYCILLLGLVGEHQPLNDSVGEGRGVRHTGNNDTAF